MNVEEIRGSAVVLKPWSERDARWYVDSRDETVFEFTTESRDLTVSQTEEAIHRVAASASEAAFAIWTAEDRLVGNVALLVSDRDAEISYFLAAPGRGKGYASEAVHIASAWALDRLNIDRVVALIVPANEASATVVERAGFAPVGRRQHAVLGEMVIWSLERSERPVRPRSSGR